MSVAPPIAETLTLEEAALAERQARALVEVAEVGVELCRALRDQVASGAEGPFADPALAFSRISRAIRLTVALQVRLAQERRTGAAPEAALPERASADPADDACETEPTVEAEADSEARPERENLHETVREDLGDAALLRRPAGEIYALACRDLGLAPEPGLFPDGAPDNDNRPGEPAPAAAAPARRIASATSRALLQSACAAPMAAAGPVLPLPLARPPP